MLTAIPGWLGQSTLYRDDAPARLMTTAVDLYDRSHSQGRRACIRSMLLKSPHHLLKLDALSSAAHDAGLRTVPTRQIRGSENRSADFDSDFHPLQARTRDRWVSIAMARFVGATLPPIELIQVGDIYYVRDGHHRLSVSRALGEEFIEAHVITRTM